MQEPWRGSGVLINIGMIFMCKRDPGPFIWDHVEFVIKAVSSGLHPEDSYTSVTATDINPWVHNLSLPLPCRLGQSL